MEASRDPKPLNPQDGDLDCTEVLQLVRRFLAGEEDVARRAVVRSHLARCESCREQYHASVETVARLARAPQAYYAGLTRAPRVQANRQGASPRRPSGKSLVKLILPAFGLYAAFAMSSRAQSDRDVRLRVLGGVVRLGENVIGVDDEPARLSRSLAGSTTEHSRARITANGSALVVEPSTSFAVERSSPLRLRLFEGVLLFDGESVVSTDAGVLETRDGSSGFIRMAGEDMEIAASRGKVEFHHPTGRVAIEPVQPLRATRRRFGAAN